MKSVEEDFLFVKKKISKLFEISLNRDKDNLRSYLLYVYGPVTDYVESVLSLTKIGKINAAKVILRTLVEVHIKINYYQIDDSKSDSYRKLAIAGKVDFDNKIKTVNEFSKLIQKHPSLINYSLGDLYNTEGQQKMISHAKSRRDIVLNFNNATESDVELNLVDMAMKCDEANSSINTEGSFLHMYTLLYRYLSPVVHLSIEGLDHFFESDDKNNVVFKVKDESSDVNETAVDIWLALVKDLFEKKVLLGDFPKEVADLEENLKKGVYNQST